jgi:hypothetical protein
MSAFLLVWLWRVELFSACFGCCEIAHEMVEPASTHIAHPATVPITIGVMDHHNLSVSWGLLVIGTYVSLRCARTHERNNRDIAILL